MNNRILATLLTFPLALGSAYAQEAGKPTVTISGFGTLAMTRTNTDDARFARPNQATGVGKTAGTGVDSNLGLQANVAVNEWLSGTVQGLVRKDAEDDFGAELAWAFVKAKISDQLSVRVGRMGLPVFMISDYRNVGYANTLVRPPREMYSQVPMNGIDGIDATWQNSFGDTNLSAQLAFGRTETRLTNGLNPVSHIQVKSLAALNLVAEHGPFTLRAGHARGKLTLTDSTGLNSLVNGLRGVGAAYGIGGATAMANVLENKDKPASFTSAGMGLDWNNIVVQSEYGVRRTVTAKSSSWYALAGYRFGKVMPFYSHADLGLDSSAANTVPTSCPAGSPGACSPTVAALSAGVNRSLNPAQESADTIGVRWDFNKSAALKVQIDRVKPKNGQGLFLNPVASFTGPVTVGAVAIDFVF